ALDSCDLVFLVSSDEVAKEFGLELARSGVWVIDDSSAYRLDKRVPLVIPEVNGRDLSPKKRLIAGPNCTMTGAALAGAALLKSGRLRAVRVASYQAVSGAGKAALAEFFGQARALAPKAGGKTLIDSPPPPKPAALPRSIAFNVFPQVGSFDKAGHSGEEWKVREELKKVWGLPRLAVSVTAVRVPVIRGHSLALWLEFERRMSPARARALLSRAPGVRLWKEGDYPTPADASGTAPAHVGRVRAGASEKEVALWVVSDNLLKGAALNSIQIAETLLKKGWLKAR
ncbi:MAG: aspartate-semialdehyde dehydrogenase, partial [Elusimicrobiota bacterium]